MRSLKSHSKGEVNHLWTLVLEEMSVSMCASLTVGKTNELEIKREKSPSFLSPPKDGWRVQVWDTKLKQKQNCRYPSHPKNRKNKIYVIDSSFLGKSSFSTFPAKKFGLPRIPIRNFQPFNWWILGKNKDSILLSLQIRPFWNILLRGTTSLGKKVIRQIWFWKLSLFFSISKDALSKWSHFDFWNSEMGISNHPNSAWGEIFWNT